MYLSIRPSKDTNIRLAGRAAFGRGQPSPYYFRLFKAIHSTYFCVSSSGSTGREAPSIGTCRALYDYTANMYDELSIRTGDVINIHDKQDDGWWLGELKGTVGIFPATYVEEN